MELIWIAKHLTLHVTTNTAHNFLWYQAKQNNTRKLCSVVLYQHWEHTQRIDRPTAILSCVGSAIERHTSVDLILLAGFSIFLVSKASIGGGGLVAYLMILS